MPEIHPTLQKIIAAMPFFQAAFPFDSMPAVSDLEKFIAYFPGKKIKMKDFTGRILDETSDHYWAIRDGKTRMSIISKDIFGFAFKSIATPVYDENDRNVIVGAVGFGFSIETEYALQEMAQSLAASSEELNAVSEEFSATSSSLADKMKILSNSSNNMYQNLEKTDDILVFLDNLADRTKLLGLNALIEAARAGEHGRSFSVVAQEIQKMSDSSTKSVDTIKLLLRNIQTEVKMVNNLIRETKDLSAQQSNASMEISSSIGSLAKITETLTEISTRL